MNNLLKRRPLKLIGMYMGYTNAFNGETFKNGINNFGTEMCSVYLAEALVKKGYFVNIYMWGMKQAGLEKTVDGVNYLDCERLKQKNMIEFDHFIINRYIHYFEYFNVPTKKLHIWVHDMIIQYMYLSKPISDNCGKEYTNKNLHKIDKVVCLSDWHKNNMIEVYEGQIGEKIAIVPHGIDVNCSPYFYKKKNSFIYVSSAIRGLTTLLVCMQKIQQVIPDASLTVFRKEELDEKQLQLISTLKNCTVYGRQPPEIVKQCMLETDFFFYPTNFFETFCCSALEAQLYQAICIYTDVGCLNSTIADRGLMLDKKPTEEDFIESACEQVIQLMQDEERKSIFRERAFNFAKTMSWDNSVEYWEKNVF
jgi:hypothetical protein